MITKLRATLREYRDVRQTARNYCMVEDGAVHPRFAEDSPVWPHNRPQSRDVSGDLR